MSLYLHSYQPDFGRLTRLATREHLLPPGDDLGYALHAAFTATFGEHGPKSFVLLAPGNGGGPAGRLLAYASQPLATLRSHAAAFADPAFSAALDLDTAADKLMPERFATATRLGFRVRVRPVARTGRPRLSERRVADGSGRARERDVFLARLDEVTADSDSANKTSSTASRAACYLTWLGERLTTIGACLEQGQVDAFRFTRLLARDRNGARTRTQHPNGPDATITGTLTVTDAESFAAGLPRGVGRFRAFGFGMLLLTPARN